MVKCQSSIGKTRTLYCAEHMHTYVRLTNDTPVVDDAPGDGRLATKLNREPLPTPRTHGPQHGFTPNCATCAHKARIFASASSPGGGGGGGLASGFIAGNNSTSRMEFLFVRNIVNLSIPVWKSTSASGANDDNSSRSHFSATTRPSWLGRAARNRHRHAIEQASRR